MRATTESPALPVVGPGYPATTRCPRCAGPVLLASPHTLVRATRVRVFCSAACLVAWQTPPEPAVDVPVSIKPGLLGRLLVAGLALGGLSNGQRLPIDELERPAFDPASLRQLSVVPPIEPTDVGASGVPTSALIGPGDPHG